MDPPKPPSFSGRTRTCALFPIRWKRGFLEMNWTAASCGTMLESLRCSPIFPRIAGCGCAPRLEWGGLLMHPGIREELTKSCRHAGVEVMVPQAQLLGAAELAAGEERSPEP